ncbi:hypothetical protein [Ancylobacter lacus]|uniref:hypothetical protein n=1 Tax=Ancylobacter lacus TaxID=2579970 RepID=UPI001BCEF8D1|nr:hypothetical protein [Ancylobacter lacus]MBS7539655.1 hypothetical protein [Ancylobacter lacus]
MTPARLVPAAALAAALLTATPVLAGPCSDRIAVLQAVVDNVLDTTAGRGGSAPESIDALLDRQPTPESIAKAEIKLGEGAAPDKALHELEKARALDAAGDAEGCKAELKKIRRLLGATPD